MTIPLPPYEFPTSPVPQVTPLTYRDNVTMLKKVDGIKKYINLVLVPWINKEYSDLSEDFETQVNVLITAVNEAIALVLNDSVEVQDSVIADNINNSESLTSEALDAKYALKSVVDAIEAIIDTGRLSETELDAAYAAKADLDAIETLVATGRLSETELDARYGLKTELESLEDTVEENQRKSAKYPFYNASPETLRRSNIALGNALRGGTPFRLLTIGDSTTQGAETVAESYPTHLVAALKRKGIRAGFGIIAPATNIPDAHWGVSAGWSTSMSIGPAGGTFRSAAGNPNALYMAPLEAYTSLKIHFVRGTGGKSVVDRAGVVVGNIDTTIGTPNTYGSLELALSGDGIGPDDLFSAQGPTLGPINILGFETDNSAAPKEVKVYNFGQSGTNTNDWVNDTLSLDAINYVAPHLSLIMLGINDAILNVSATDYMSRMANIINVAKSHGDVIVIGFPESNPTFMPGIGALQDAYESQMKDYCKTNNIPYFDFKERAGAYSNYATNDWYRDEVHQSNEANMSIALSVADLIV